MKVAPIVDIFYQISPLKRHLRIFNLEKINGPGGCMQEFIVQEKWHFGAKSMCLPLKMHHFSGQFT